MSSNKATRAGLIARHSRAQTPNRLPRFALTGVMTAALLSACGGGDDSNDPSFLTFTAGADPVTYQLAIGNDAPNAIAGGDERTYSWGLGGDDRLAAGSSGGNLFGDSGADVLVGNAGADRLVGGHGGDELYGGGAGDALMGGAGNDHLDEGMGHGDLDGGMGNDTLVGGAGPDAFMVGPSSGHDTIKDFTAGPGMFDHLAIMDLRWDDLSFEDTAAGVRVSWTDGSVLIEGVRMEDLAQDDFMFAMSPDLPPGLRAPAGPTAERPTPSVKGPAVDGQRSGGGLPSNLSFQGDERYQITVGTNSNDTLRGTGAWDHLFGRDGHDTLEGGDGDDILEGNAGNDTLAGGAGRDKLDGGSGEDQLSGGEAEDEIKGGDGNDVIDAGAGHDMIEGEKGNDTIAGGTGADAFMVSPDSGDDVVLDFEAAGDAQGAFDHIAFMGILPEHVTVTDTAAGALVRWDTNGDGTAEGSVVLQGLTRADLRQSDFMFEGRPGFVAGISSVGSYFVFPIAP